MENLPIYKLVIDDSDELGVDYIALVDSPAIEKTWFAFKEHELIVEPKAGESKDEFISRCIGVEVGNGIDQEQATAICYSKWENKGMNAQFKFFANHERRLISGPLMISDLPIYRADESGEYYVVFDKDQIEKIAQRFFKKGYSHNVNMMHDPERQVNGVYMVESFIIDKTRGIKTPEGYPTLTEGSWFGTFKVDNNEVWNDFIRTGVFKGFSVEGAFAHRKVTEKPMTEIEKIADRIQSLRQKIKNI